MTTDQREPLRAALINLSNEVIGSLPLMEAQARQAIGNTNYTCLMQRAEEARAVLAALPQAQADGWQDIASAPKDVEVEVRGIWQTRGGGVQFTHWRPLPATPVIAEESEVKS